MSARTSSHRTGERGFTLLEVLVVLMIAALIGVVLMQGLGVVLNLRDNFSGTILDLDRTVVKRNLIRQPLTGVVPDFNDGEQIFAGTPESVSGLTLRPLLRRPGRPTAFSLALTYDPGESLNELTYREERDEPVVLAEWTGPQASFRYMGMQTDWTPVWPPDGPNSFGAGQIITELRPPQLPELVFLDTQSADEPDVAVAMTARRNRIPRDPELFGGSAQ